jgi:hypothetical protein
MIKMSQLKVDGTIVGSVVRYRGQERVEIYIAYQDGALE